MGTNKPVSKIIVIDQHNEKKVLNDSKILHEFCIKIKNAKINLKRCITAFRDPESMAFMGMSTKQDRKLILLDIFFPNYKNMKDYEYEGEKISIENLISKLGYKITASKLYMDPDDPQENLLKIIVTL